MNLPYRSYLIEELASQLRLLPPDQEPNFGLMSPQHMVEHLVVTTKFFSRRKGEPSGEPLSKSAQSFQRFVAKGCPFEHRPKEGVTKADLPELRFKNMEEGIVKLEEAVAEFYAFGDADAAYKSYNPMTGEFHMEQLDLIIGRHAKWHAFQFGLLEAF